MVDRLISRDAMRRSHRSLLALVAASASLVLMQPAEAIEQVLEGADGAKIKLSLADGALRIAYSVAAPAAPSWERTIYLALDLGRSEGSAVLPFAEKLEGSTCFCHFARTNSTPSRRATSRSGMAPDLREVEVERTRRHVRKSSPCNSTSSIALVELPVEELGTSGKSSWSIYSKDLRKTAWGRLFGASDLPAARRRRATNTSRTTGKSTSSRRKARRSRLQKGRLTTEAGKLRIYQMFPRLFGNTNETRKPNGTLAENGVGKFKDINDAALKSLRDGVHPIWLPACCSRRQRRTTPSIGQPADDPDLLKGLAGSPYAIKDYFDVCPDYAEKPEKRLDEFKALLKRMRDNGMQTLIDFVPKPCRAQLRLGCETGVRFRTKGRDGAGDESKFFDPQNNSSICRPGSGGPPLRLPTVKDGKAISPTCVAVAAVSDRRADDKPHVDGGHRPPLQVCDGLFEPEKEHGKVTGNNKASWTPELGDWYETVKLNYGYDFTDATKKVREYPNAITPEKPVPDTWKKMDRVLEYWQSLGVDGFRCDMAHMEPPEFWAWAIARARARQPDVVFIAEAYDNDPAKVPGSDPIVSELTVENRTLCSIC